MLDLDDEGESPFYADRNASPSVAERLPRKAAGRIKLLMLVLLVVGVVGLVAVTLYRYGNAVVALPHRLQRQHRSPRHPQRNSRSQVLDALGGDIDRNIFHISL